MAEKIVSTRTYAAIYGVLMVLVLATTLVAYVDLGWGNLFVAMTIACVKATLVALVFMHLKYSDKMSWVFAGAGVFWLAILFVLSLNDYLTRGWLPWPGP